jgi:hypothetical protein
MGNFVETLDWSIAIPAGLALSILIGGMLMMFTGLWTQR